ncbi:MAG: site-specific integrase [Zoogloeaceae bacterium]|jgi:integrase|nr:site-specific integrase [Zoogloeaceae bacterium]
MASIRQRASGTFEVRFLKKGVLDAPVYMTFPTRGDAEEFSRYASALLSRGTVPTELAAQMGAPQTLEDLLDAYNEAPGLPDSERELVRYTRLRVKGVKTLSVGYEWAEGWVRSLKNARFSASSIKKRVGCLARCFDWAKRRGLLPLGENPLRLLPRGYAAIPGVSGERDRRLSAAEEEALRKTLRTREERLLFDMALETAMRLSEMLSLRTDQVSLSEKTIYLFRTKNGRKRQVPMSSVMCRELAAWLPGCEGRVFPSWQHRPVRVASNRLSRLFAIRARQAGIEGLRFHDLRHEATSRLYERTTLTDLQIAKITGHTDLKSLQRYANLRASELAGYLW